MLSVSELNEQAKSLLEVHFSYVEVVGEISRLVRHNSGHWYFTLKDDKAAISAVMYRANNAKLKFELKDGMRVVLNGKISLYTPSGSYQLIASSMRPDGLGELELAFNQLKEKLELEGLFSADNKKPIPKIPRKIALITSATSAALQDMLRIANARFRLCEILVFNALTQGENAPNSLINALKKADDSGACVIVLARGGGSKEDLWCFNNEALARQIYAASTPVVSAIGHEIDYVISDFVADKRAPTPSAAMSEILPDSNVLAQYIDEIAFDIDSALNAKIARFENEIKILSLKFSPQALLARIEAKFNQIDNISLKFKNTISQKMAYLNSLLKQTQAKFEAQEEFFKATKNLVQVQKNGKNANLAELNLGDEIELISQDITRKSVITK